MTQIRTQVITYRIDKLCPKCEIGVLIATENIVHLNTFSYYEHRCSNCKHMMSLQNIKYPHNVTEDIGVPEYMAEIDNTLAEQQNIVNEINYNCLCAEATLGHIPKLTVEDIFPSSTDNKNANTN